jgi:DNA-binding MarR family transcriptional regulator
MSIVQDFVMSGESFPQSEQTLGFLLRSLYDALQERVYGALAARGFPDIRAAHSVVFRHIARTGSRVSELAEMAGMTKQSMAYLVETLTEGGYVTVKPDPTDGRAKIVCLTARGRKVAFALIRLSRSVEADFAALVGSDRMAMLRELLGDLATALAAATRQTNPPITSETPDASS